MRRLILSEASDWELSQVDNTEFDKGWDRTLKFMEEFEALTAHLPSYGMLFLIIIVVVVFFSPPLSGEYFK